MKLSLGISLNPDLTNDLEKKPHQFLITGSDIIILISTHYYYCCDCLQWDDIWREAPRYWSSIGT